MKKKILFGTVISATILVLISIAPTINANVSKPDIDILVENVTPTPFALVSQLITKLQNHKDIKNVESEDDLLRIIEGDEELNSIYEQIYGEDCGCNDGSQLGIWPFPIICLLLTPFIFSAVIFLLHGEFDIYVTIVFNLAGVFGCWGL